MPNRPYLVERIIPAHAVHLFGGPSGAGKTRMLFQWIDDLCKGKPILGFKVPRPLTIGYAYMDRDSDSVHETMEGMGIDPEMPNFNGICCATRKVALTQIPLLFDPIPDLLLLDGIPTLLPHGDANNYIEVADFLRHCLRIAKQYNTTIMGILHATKTKENERYLNPRQRISGSVAWGAYSDSDFVLEPIKPENSNDHRRTLWVLPRNSEEFTRDFTFNSQGRLIELSVVEEQDSYSILLSLISLTTLTSRNEILDMALNLQIGKSKCDEWLAQCVADGRLWKPEYGKYQRKPIN